MWLKIDTSGNDELMGDTYVNLDELRKVEVVRHYTPRAGSNGEDLWNIVGFYGRSDIDRVVLAAFPDRSAANVALHGLLDASRTTVIKLDGAPGPVWAR